MSRVWQRVCCGPASRQPRERHAQLAKWTAKMCKHQTARHRLQCQPQLGVWRQWTGATQIRESLRASSALFLSPALQPTVAAAHRRQQAQNTNAHFRAPSTARVSRLRVLHVEDPEIVETSSRDTRKACILWLDRGPSPPQGRCIRLFPG